jgi:hypothetical protein
MGCPRARFRSIGCPVAFRTDEPLVSGLLAANVSKWTISPCLFPAPSGRSSLSAVARSATWPKPLLLGGHPPDTDGMSLLDYAGSQLGWHPDWPEARQSVRCGTIFRRSPRSRRWRAARSMASYISAYSYHPCPSSTTWRPRRHTSTTAAGAFSGLRRRTR